MDQFEKENIVIPRVNEEIIDIILNKASANFDWSNISPTFFGGVFESTLNPDTRRAGGMNDTSIENNSLGYRSFAYGRTTKRV